MKPGYSNYTELPGSQSCLSNTRTLPTVPVNLDRLWAGVFGVEEYDCR